MNEPWWKQLDVVKAASVFMTLKVLIPYSSLFTLPSIADNGLLLVALFLFASLFWMRSLHTRTFFISLVLCAAAAYTCMVIDDFSILITVITLAVLCNYDAKSFIRVMFWTSLLFCMLHVIYTLGYSAVYSPAPFLLISGARSRFTFGFVHPNFLGTLAASILMMFLWLYSSRHFWPKLLAVFVIQLVIFLFIDSRTSLLAGLFNLLLLAWVKLKNPQKTIRFLLCVVIPLLTAFMLVMMHLYINGNDLAMKVNRLLNSRIQLGAYAYHHLGISLFGQFVPFHANMQWDPVWNLTSFTFDNAYSYLLIQGGIFWVLVLCGIFIVISRRISAKNGVFLLIWAVYGMCENTVLNGYMMFPIFLIAEGFSHKKRICIPKPVKADSKE